MKKDEIKTQHEIIEKDKNVKKSFEKKKNVRFVDYLFNSVTIFSASLMILILVVLLGFIFKNGANFNFSLLTSNYHPTAITSLSANSGSFEGSDTDKVFFSKKYGIGLKSIKKPNGEETVIISTIKPNSPFNSFESDGKLINVTDFEIRKLIGVDSHGDYHYIGRFVDAREVRDELDLCERIYDMTLYDGGGGIRSSLLITLILIVLTLIVAVPIGILVAIYINEFAKENKITRTLVSLINMINGIPSIIFGLVGAAVFVPLVSLVTGRQSLSIIAGSLTMLIIILPVIISTTIESLRSVPISYREASLSLGASETQTAFKVVLPSAKGGVLTSVLLSISRIIGESAALIFVMGSGITDSISLLRPGTTLAVHIWSVMAGETPNVKLASTISVYIIFIILILSLSLKYVNYRTNKRKGLL